MKPKDYSLLTDAVKGNKAAEALLRDGWGAMAVWDDLIDQDRVPTPEEINLAMWRLIATIPANPFYREHFADLFPLIKNAALTWMASNEVEEEHRLLAKTMALHFIDLIVACALICGGVDHAVVTARVNWLAFFLEEE
ncbi:MAG TPA: hypothetical protein VNS88_07930 [Nitrospiraceae bacterium]|nr:hypothetical protein [Nitrospiraceae bacterium]